MKILCNYESNVIILKVHLKIVNTLNIIPTYQAQLFLLMLYYHYFDSINKTNNMPISFGTF